MTSVDTQIAGASVAASPEFVDHKGMRALFGLSRAHAYQLASEGKIRSVSLRKPGTIRGRRLFDCASIRAFFAKCADDTTGAEEGKRKKDA
jgi:hypothetical protein